MTGSSKIKMDGATFIHARDGDLIIKRRTAMNWIAIVILGSVEICILGWFLSNVSGLVGEIFAQSGSIEAIAAAGWTILIVIGASGFLGLIVFLLLRSMRRPSAYFRSKTGVLELGRGRSSRQIPFSRISGVTSAASSAQVAYLILAILLFVLSLVFGDGDLPDTTIRSLTVLLDDGERIGLGTVSGQKANKRGTRIVQEIRELVNVPAEPTAT